MDTLKQTKKWLSEVIEISLLLIAVGISAEILFGTSIPFFGGIVRNLTELIGALGENGVVGLVALSIICFVFYKKQKQGVAA